MSSPDGRDPILVTGSHRSGTTWTGRMLCASGQAGYIHEPFNPRRQPGWTGNRIPYWFLHVHEGNESTYEPVLADVMKFRYPFIDNLAAVRGPRQVALYASDGIRGIAARARRLRPLMKDPIALFSAEWIARRFDSRVVVMIRHPAGFVSSIKRLDWRFRFRSWIAQEALMDGFLSPYAEQIVDHWRRDVDIVDQGILMWNAMHTVIDRYRNDHPEWIFLRHEDLARDPVHGFEDLYVRVGLDWGAQVEATVRKNSAEVNPSETSRARHGSVRRDSTATERAWTSRLTSDEIARTLEGTATVARSFYSEEELRPPISA